MQPEDLNRS